MTVMMLALGWINEQHSLLMAVRETLSGHLCHSCAKNTRVSPNRQQQRQRERRPLDDLWLLTIQHCKQGTSRQAQGQRYGHPTQASLSNNATAAIRTVLEKVSSRQPLQRTHCATRAADTNLRRLYDHAQAATPVITMGPSGQQVELCPGLLAHVLDESSADAATQVTLERQMLEDAIRCAKERRHATNAGEALEAALRMATKVRRWSPSRALHGVFSAYHDAGHELTRDVHYTTLIRAQAESGDEDDVTVPLWTLVCALTQTCVVEFGNLEATVHVREGCVHTNPCLRTTAHVYNQS